MRTARALLVAIAVGAVLPACDAIFGIQQFTDDPVEAGPDAASAETGGEVGVPVEAGADAPTPEASSGIPCVDAGSCPASAPACSQGLCTAVRVLLPGTSNTQCVILDDSTLWCWGANGGGQLGRGAVGGAFYAPAPVTVLPPGSVVEQAGAGMDFACALTSNDHLVRCWGQGLAGSGDGNTVKVALPADAVELSVSAIAGCARVTSNDVYCWGDDSNSNIGCSSVDAGPATVSALAPQLVFDASKHIAHIASGRFATCGQPQDTSRQAYCVGNGQWGTLGAGPVQGSCSSATLGGFAGNSLDHVFGSDFATCTVDDDAVYYCWGMNYVWYGAGLLDPGNNAQQFATPYAMPLPSPTTGAVTIGWLHGCALDTGGNVSCWGASTHGETGIYSSAAVPIRKVAGLADVQQIVAQRQFTCALQQDGQVLCWGNNTAGDIVSPDAGTDTPTPTAIVW